MQAYTDGKQIQCKSEDIWLDWNTRIEPVWDWRNCEYRIKPEPKEPIYRPYKDFGEFRAEWEKHGGWVIVENGKYIMLTGFNIRTTMHVLEAYRWADDETPCGIKVEE